MQVGPVAGNNEAGQDDPVPPICRAIRQALDESGVTQEALAARLGVRQSSIQKWATHREPRLDRVLTIEQALGHPRGYLLRLAGYVQEARSTEEVIRADTRLLPDGRDSVLDLYRSFVSRSAAKREAPAPRVSPRAPRRRSS